MTEHSPWMNLAKITTPEHLKALGLALLLVPCQHSDLPDPCLSSGHDPVGIEMSTSPASSYLIFILPMWMNFLLRTLAWQNLLEKNGVINSVLHFFGSAFMEHYQHTDSDHPRYGLQLPAVHGAADLQCTCTRLTQDVISRSQRSRCQIISRHLPRSSFRLVFRVSSAESPWYLYLH